MKFVRKKAFKNKIGEEKKIYTQNLIEKKNIWKPIFDRKKII